jgi:hypothetical protein
MAKKHLKKCSTSLGIEKMQIKSMLRFPPLLLEWLPSRTQTITNFGKDVGGKGTLIHSW